MARHIERRHHQSERFFLAMLVPTQARYRVGLARVHEQLKSADPPEGHNATCPESASRAPDGRGFRLHPLC